MSKIIDRLRNEPALVIGLLVGTLLGAAEVLDALANGLSGLSATSQGLRDFGFVVASAFGVRQLVYGPKTADELLDADAVISAAEDEGDGA